MSSDANNYQFVAKAGEQYVELDIRDEDDRAKKFLRGPWLKMCLAEKAFHENVRSIAEAPGWSKWSVDTWAQGTPDADELRYFAWDDESVVGLLFLRTNFVSEATGLQALYVENMAGSPGCLESDLWERRLSEIGETLLAYSVLVSERMGYQGVLGLHAVDEVARSYYLHLDAKMGGIFGTQKIGVAGPDSFRTKRRENLKGLTYFETTVEGSRHLLEVFRNNG